MKLGFGEGGGGILGQNTRFGGGFWGKMFGGDFEVKHAFWGGGGGILG